MRELQQKQQFKKRLYSIPAIILLFVLTILIIRGTYLVFQKKNESADYVSSLNKKASELTAQNAELTANIASMATPDGIEKEIKEKFNVTKAGEREAILVDPGPTSTDESAEKAPWYRRIWDML